MGPGGIVSAARAATAGSALRAWGDAIADAVERNADLLTSARPLTLDEGVARLVPQPLDRIRTTGWELRHAFAWFDDARCVERGVFGGLSHVERSAGGIDEAVAQVARRDALDAAIAIHYTPNFGANTRLHASFVARGSDDRLYAVDHLFADAPDGVMPLDEWLRRTGGTREGTRLLSVLDAPPMGLRGGPGIPAIAKPHTPRQWRGLGEGLAGSWTRANLEGRAQVEPVVRGR